MIVLVHSLGRVWQEKPNDEGSTSVWNTTGINDGVRTRPRSKTFGQVSFTRRARLALSGSRPITPSLWVTSGLNEHGNSRKLQLIVRAPTACAPDRYLVTITETLVGHVDDRAWETEQTQLVSHSEWKGRQELMLLMRPFGWIRGAGGTAVLIVDDKNRCSWSVNPW
jgi:hypothetical protein